MRLARASAVWSGLVLMMAVSTGCGLGVQPPGPETSEPSASPEAPEPEQPPELPACEDNTDCQGGEVCRDDVCRTACATDDECDGFYGVCSLDLGLCVACASDEHCDDNERCTDDNLCAFFCDDDAACADDEFCDTAAGTCVDKECEDNADCQGGFRCDGFICVSIDEVVCNAGSAQCEDNAMVVCSADGTSRTVTPCGDEQACVANDDGVSCVDVVCSPNALGCVDDDTAFACNASGTERAELPCGATQYCADGVCRDEVCTPNSVTCDGNLLVTCDATGASQTVVSCIDDTLCTSDAGCQCTPAGDSASCVERVCVPGTGQCVGNGRRVCLDDGSGYDTPADCDEGSSCNAGTCLSSMCTPGDMQCAGEVLLTCNDAGTGYDEVDCAEGNQLCIDADDQVQCSDPVCTPGDVGCTDGMVSVCDERGAGASVTPCDDGETCVGGACQAQLCTPNDVGCQGNSVATCNADGTAESLSPCGANETCTDGTCVPDVCVPQCGDRVCGLDPVCGLSCGTCGDNQACNVDGACVTLPDTDPDELHFQLTWSTATGDLDILLMRSDALCAADTVDYGNKTPDWDGMGNGPTLDIDDLDGYGPENISWASPIEGSYKLGAHFYSAGNNNGAAVTVATLRVFRGGEEVVSHTFDMNVRDLFVADVSVTSSSVTVDFAGGERVAGFTACQSDNCASGQGCPNGRMCHADLEVCVADPDTVETCTDNNDCDMGEVCTGQVCVPAGENCTQHSQCNSGELCVDGSCAAAPQCTINANCPDGATCVSLDLGLPLPLPLGQCAEGCKDDSECVGQERCASDGSCTTAPLAGPGEACGGLTGGGALCEADTYCDLLNGVCVSRGG